LVFEEAEEQTGLMFQEPMGTGNMAEPNEPLQENEVGAFGDLVRRPNPEALVILPVPPVESLIATLQQQLGRELTQEEVENQRFKAPSIVVAKEAAAAMSAAQAGRKTAVQTTGWHRPPTVRTSYNEMPADGADRNEAAVELFGQHLFSLRNQRIEHLRHLLESAEDRMRLGSLHRKEYDAVAALDAEGREAACALAQRAIDLYLQDVLTLFTGTGDSLCFDAGYAINYRVILQVKEIRSDEVVEEFEINRKCKKVFYDYYGRWLNRYGDHR
jgi:hypothetical protein